MVVVRCGWTAGCSGNCVTRQEYRPWGEQEHGAPNWFRNIDGWLAAMIEIGSLLPVVKSLVEKATPQWKKDRLALRRRIIESVSRSIPEHHTFVVEWCQEMHLLLAGRVDAGTVELAFRSIPRRLGVAGGSVAEIDLLLDERHVVVLGDPGAGKTTTLRRLASFVSAGGEFCAEDQFRFVVLIVCREQRWPVDRSLYDILGDCVGVTTRLVKDADNPHSIIREILNGGALIVIDGLDEVPAGRRIELEHDIVSLGRHLHNAKVVVSCRSGAYQSHLEGFRPAEIVPLTDVQIREVVKEFLGEDAPQFYEAILRPDHPARGLANRPLFLVQMVNIFRRRGNIPSRPVDLYDAIVRLVLEDWDARRNVKRTSEYANFSVEDKRRFLADLAFDLLGKDLIRFGTADLVESYRIVADRYHLPSADARKVVNEIESHTGLVVDSGDSYEFSHLSLQEYLAADAMVRGSRSAIHGWCQAYPEVAAVATGLSSTPNDWFADLVDELTFETGDARSLRTFLHRLALEQPRFTRSAELGDKILICLSRCRTVDEPLGTRFGTIPSVRGSVADAMSLAQLTSSGGYALIIRDATDEADVYNLKLSIDVLRYVIGKERLWELLRRT
jgi:hypothetical protein